MNKPRIAQVIDGQDKYWNNQNHPLPAWAFDFVSVHGQVDGKHTLISPMCIPESNPDMARPAFEGIEFTNKKEATEAAKAVCKNRKGEHHLFVVICK